MHFVENGPHLTHAGDLQILFLKGIYSLSPLQLLAVFEAETHYVIESDVSSPIPPTVMVYWFPE